MRPVRLQILFASALMVVVVVCDEAAVPTYRLGAPGSGYPLAIYSVFVVIFLKYQPDKSAIHSNCLHMVRYSLFSNLLLVTQPNNQHTLFFCMCVKGA